MKVSYRWLQEYVDIPWSPEELADRLTMAGLEVEGVEKLAPVFTNVVVGQVEEVKPHPNADLSVCVVSDGLQPVQVVCGAPNVQRGMKAPFAKIGATLPGGPEIGQVELRGVSSHGMLCSEKELGIGEDASGLMVLPDDCPVGLPLQEVLFLDDFILDISVYANRPDCMSVMGIAREVAALAGTRLRYPELDCNEEGEDISSMTSVQVLDTEKCPRYSARVLTDVKIKQSPLWMQAKLRASGMRPINNVVDITNYVMLETGQPLHAFDYDTLQEHRIVVRTARPGEKLLTLDGEERELNPENLMICDAESPVCIAGVMGGENSEVGAKTERLLLESANFAPTNIRRTARQLGIPSESSARFEKGVHPLGTLWALDRAAQLLQKYASAVIAKGVIDQNQVGDRKETVLLDPMAVTNLLGAEIPPEDMVAILTSLEFGVDPSLSPWRVQVPAHRRDIELECDLIEEIARIWGYGRIPLTLPSGKTTAGGQSRKATIITELKRTLVGAGLSEAVTYSFVHPNSLKQIRCENGIYPDMIPIANPLTEDISRMRVTLMPGLLNSVALNVSRQQSRIALFEEGSVYLGDSLPLTRQPQEESRLTLVLYGDKQEPNWANPAAKYDFYDLKGCVDLILQHFSAQVNWEHGTHNTLHPTRQAEIKVEGNIVGYLGELHPDVQKTYRLSERTYIAEISLERLIPYWKSNIKFTSLPRFPKTERDLALLLDESVLVQDVLECVQLAGGPLLVKTRVFDLYAGEQVRAGKKSVAFSFEFQADRTLVEEEVNKLMDAIMLSVKQKYGAEIR